MCVIVYKPGGVKFPTEDDIDLMHTVNNDGMGLMFAYKGKVYGKKFNQFKLFKEDLNSLPRAFPVMMHFRLATHGGDGIDHAQPFPFPVTKQNIFQLEWNSLMGIMHNGIISGFGDGMTQRTVIWKRVGGKEYTEIIPPKPGLSDTQEFLLFLSSDRELTRQFISMDRGLLKLVYKLSSSKFGILNGTGKARLVGNWEQKKGLWYSNMFWINYRKYYDTEWMEKYYNEEDKKDWQKVWTSTPSPTHRGYFIGQEGML